MDGERRAGYLKTKGFLQSAEIKLILLIAPDLFVPATDAFERLPFPKTASGLRKRPGQPQRNPVAFFVEQIYPLTCELPVYPVFKDCCTTKDICVHWICA